MTSLSPDRPMTAYSPMHPVIGALRCWPVSSDFDEFETDDMLGLARVVGDRIDILVMSAKEPGHGAGGRFLDALTQNYAHVRVLEVLNSDLSGMLERRGFAEFSRWEDGERVSGFERISP